MIVHTANSSYELDLANYRIRKLTGTGRSGYFGKEHEWKLFHRLAESPTLGSALQICIDEEKDHWVITTPITHIKE